MSHNKPEIVNLLNMPVSIKNIDNCSSSINKGAVIEFTLEEAKALCDRHNLTLVGATSYDPDVEAYNMYIAIEKGDHYDSLYLITMTHHGNFVGNEYQTTPFYIASLDDCGAPPHFKGEMFKEFHNVIGQFTKLM